ncbi:MAG: amidohydrolase [Acidobacteria bacterium]|nr:amidohydrolase [Acidobacteriota bacterium]
MSRPWPGRARTAAWLCIAVAGAAVAAAAARPAPPADLVLSGGAIYTVDAARSWAETVAIRDGRIVYVGSDDGARAWVGPATRVVELGGRFVLPGFHDSHLHPITGGMRTLRCELSGAATAAEALDRVRAYAAAHPDAPWIVGRGWELFLFPAANPRKETLDAVIADRPVYLTSADGHSAWVNSRALALASVTAATPDPPLGRIERDGATGMPSGTLREEAKQLVSRLLPEATAAERREGIVRAVELAHRAGLVGLFDATVDAIELPDYREVGRQGKLDVHLGIALYVDPEKPFAPQLAELLALRREDWGPHVRITAAKLYADGVIESGTAALLEPYLDRDGSRGVLEWDEGKLREAAIALDREGFQLHVHAIGDRAIRVTLDTIAAVRRANGPRDRRPTLAHIELFDPADVPRFRALGAIASFQPLWAWADPYIKDLTEPQLGPERSRWLYPIGSVAATGAVLAGGSDWSVSSMVPLEGIEVAVTRRGPAEGPGPAWIGEERASLATMLAAYTIGSAYAAFRERETGSLEVGKSADLVVLDRNLFAVPPHEISEAKVLLTLFAGREVYRDPAMPASAPMNSTGGTQP